MKTIRYSRALALVVLLLPGWAFAQGSKASQPAQPPAPPAPADMEAPIIAWTNLARMQQGKAPLRVNDDLTRAARMHARNMANQDQMSHSLDGYTLVDRVRRTGYSYVGLGENIAFVGGYAYPAWMLFDGWMRSEGHYRNIMKDEFTEIGVGVARAQNGKYYACQVFGRPGSAPLYMPVQSPYTGAPMMPYRPYGAAPQGRPPWQTPPQSQMTPYSPNTGAPAWMRTTSYPQPRPPQPAEDIRWWGPWDWRD